MILIFFNLFRVVIIMYIIVVGCIFCVYFLFRFLRLYIFFVEFIFIEYFIGGEWYCLCVKEEFYEEIIIFFLCVSYIGINWVVVFIIFFFVRILCFLIFRGRKSCFVFIFVNDLVICKVFLYRMILGYLNWLLWWNGDKNSDLCWF